MRLSRRIEFAALTVGGGRHTLSACRPILAREVGDGCRRRARAQALHRGGVVGPRHVGCVINATRLFITRLGDRAVVSPQNPVVIPPRSEPQPDLLLLRPRAVSYSRELPTSQDVLLAVEVADTTVSFDRLVKARLYARAGIPELWLCLAMDGAVEVYRSPSARRLRRRDAARPRPDRGATRVPGRQLRGVRLLRVSRMGVTPSRLGATAIMAAAARPLR